MKTSILICSLATTLVFTLGAATGAEKPTSDPVPKARVTKAAPAAAKEQPSGDTADARREQIMKDIVSLPFENNRDMQGTIPFAISAYWLNERLPEADAAVIRVSSPESPGVGSKKDEKSESNYHFYRQSFLLQRVYFLFNSRSEYFPGRMSKAAEDAVAASMWKWASKACTKEMTLPKSMWWSGGSENIIGRNMASLWGAAQIFASHPDYRDRKYADGTPVAEMARAFNDYYKHFTCERASRGGDCGGRLAGIRPIYDRRMV